MIAIDTIHSYEFSSQLMFQKDYYASIEPKYRTKIVCRLSALEVAALEDPDKHIRVRHGIMKDVPRRLNKKKRIQKKWIKRYGMKQSINFIQTIYRIIDADIDFQNDKVTFDCLAIRAEKGAY